jgi:excisionase family DNA binding protein
MSTINSLIIDDAARQLGVSRRTIYYWIRSGRLRTVRTRASQRVTMESLKAAARAPRRRPWCRLWRTPADDN